MELFNNEDVQMASAPALGAAPFFGFDIETSSVDGSASPVTVTGDTPPPSTADTAASTPDPTETPASSKSPTPPPAAGGAAKKKKTKVALPVQLIGDLPIARDEALSTFKVIEKCWYQSQKMGLSRETLESMNCDCTFVPGQDDADTACGHNSNCINRLTQVECLADECRCKKYCLNQRFQKRQYSNIDVVKTEKKGFGLRAESLIEKDAFIYEYVGDVVDDKKFKRRMKEYADDGIKHFYFMMLQKDEFIDATKNGGIGRFANHSCNPNCYVAKWTIGPRVRMGIFAKRTILKYEELTFDYNVDRYGHDAQVCHCGEPMCVGFIGGKTQTISDDMLDALGLDEDERKEYKAAKRRKGKKSDDVDDMSTAHEIKLKEAPKVISALRQGSTPKVIRRLLNRLHMTEDPVVLRQLMRLRGLSLMKNILEDNVDDADLLILALGSLLKWPFTHRNKIDASKIEVELEKCLDSTNETVKTMAEQLKLRWDALTSGYRIPKRSAEEISADQLLKQDAIADQTAIDLTADIPKDEMSPNSKRAKILRTRFAQPANNQARTVPGNNGFLVPTMPRAMVQPMPRGQHIPPMIFNPRAVVSNPRPVWDPQQTTRKVAPPDFNPAQKIIEDARLQAVAAEQAREQAARLATERLEKESAEKKEARAKRKKERKEKEKGKEPRPSSSAKKHRDTAEKEANKEKRLLKLIGAVVVKTMSKYAHQVEHDTFKKHAKELTQLIADKEKKSSSYREGRLDALSDEKVAKVKKFSKDYIAKLLRNLEKTGRLKQTSGPKEGEAGPSNGGAALPSTESIVAGLAADVDDRTAAIVDEEKGGESDSESEAEPEAEGGGEGERQTEDGAQEVRDGEGDVSMDMNMLPSMSRPPDSESPMDVDPPPYQPLIVKAS